MIILLKLLIIAAVVGLLRSSRTFREMSREWDEAAIVSLKRIIRVTEESGYPAETVFLLISFTIIAFMAMSSAVGR